MGGGAKKVLCPWRELSSLRHCRHQFVFRKFLAATTVSLEQIICTEFSVFDKVGEISAVQVLVLPKSS